MEIGTGIFIGLSLIALVLLYINTKQNWNWKKIILYTVTIPLGLGLILYTYFSIKDAYQNRNRIITEFKGISIGENINDVLFKNANINPEPLELSEPNVRVYSSENYFDQFDGHDFTDESLHIYTKNNLVKNITYVCHQESPDFTKIGGIQCNSSGEDIQKKYQDKVNIYCYTDKQPALDDESSQNKKPWKKYQSGVEQRYYLVKEYGLKYILIKNKVSAIIIENPKDIETKNYSDCH